MSARAWSLFGLALCVAGWWFSPWSPRVPAAAAAMAGTQSGCPLPPRVADGHSGDGGGGRIVRLQRAERGDLEALDGVADRTLTQVGRERLDLGEFGHALKGSV